MSTLTRIQFSRALALATHYHHWWACIGGYPLQPVPGDSPHVIDAKARINSGYAREAVHVEDIHKLVVLRGGKVGSPFTFTETGALYWSTTTQRLMWWVSRDGTVRIEVQRPHREENRPATVATAVLSPFNKLDVTALEDQPIEARHIQALETAVNAILHDNNFRRSEFAPLWARVEDFDDAVREIIRLGGEHGAACLTPVEHTTDGSFSTSISVPQAEHRLRQLWARLAYLHDARRNGAACSLHPARA